MGNDRAFRSVSYSTRHMLHWKWKRNGWLGKGCSSDLFTRSSESEKSSCKASFIYSALRGSYEYVVTLFRHGFRLENSSRVIISIEKLDVLILVLHNFYSRYRNTKVFAWKQAAGYGLKCHRVIKSICEMIGIKDLGAKVEGSTNTESVIQAFLIGLLRQVVSLNKSMKFK